MKCVQEAQELNLKKIFILTRIPEYFERYRFVESQPLNKPDESKMYNPMNTQIFKRIRRDDLPPAAWADCVACPRFPDCDEIPMMLEL
jgi:amino-acid N-acetyltransferase